MDDTTALIATFFAASGKTVTLLRLGRFGEVLRIVRAGKAAAEKNGTDPWLFNFREAWLRTLAFDFDGACRLCDFIARPDVEYPTEQPKTIALIAAGYSELSRGNHAQAIDSFKRVRDPEPHTTFFLHWFWRMIAQLGLSNVFFESGNLIEAQCEAESFLESALSTDDPYLHALAWELKSRLAIAEKNWNQAHDFIERGLGIIDQFDVPVAAWPIHATARELYLRTKDEHAAEICRTKAEQHIFTIADSFAPGEPLRELFLSASPVRQILKPYDRKSTSKKKRREAADAY